MSPDSAEAVANKWAKTGQRALAVVAGRNAVVATSRKQALLDSGPFQGEWFQLARIVGGQITALDAATGVLRRSVELPAAPTLDALSLDRDGNALVGLQDGSVACVGGP